MSPALSALVSNVSAVGLSAVLLFGARMPLSKAPTAVSKAYPTRPPVAEPAPAFVETGLGSFYATKYHGRRTASGELFDMNALTAAHPRLAFGRRVKVTCLANGRSVVARINDRGPFLPNRVIDLSLAAAEELGMVQAGVTQVRLELIQ